MKTEIYSEPELELSVEASEEWVATCKELGLTNQIGLSSKEDRVGPPYRFCDPRTTKIILAICPRVVELDKYKASTIPLDVLQEAKKCKDNGWYSKLWVAYDDQSPDPFLLGEIAGEQSWNGTFHQIARWGDELLPWEELERKAIERITAIYTASIRKFKAEVDAQANMIEENVQQFLADKLDTLNFRSNLRTNMTNSWM